MLCAGRPVVKVNGHSLVAWTFDYNNVLAWQEEAGYSAWLQVLNQPTDLWRPLLSCPLQRPPCAHVRIMFSFFALTSYGLNIVTVRSMRECCIHMQWYTPDCQIRACQRYEGRCRMLG